MQKLQLRRSARAVSSSNEKDRPKDHVDAIATVLMISVAFEYMIGIEVEGGKGGR
jgi:hypothetical protein